MSDLPKPPKRPCGSCPYRKDVASGIWDAEEYVKLPQYDGTIMDQMMKGGAALFMCHQQDGCLCGGWLQTHGTDDLAALRLKAVHESAYGYTSDVECFDSGAEAAAHGMTEIENPSERAHQMMNAITSKRSKRDAR